MNDGARSVAVFGFALEDVARVVGGVAILCYVIGLLVVQFYLFTLGVSDFALVRTRYILTGSLALVPLATIGLIALVVVAVNMRSRGKSDQSGDVPPTHYKRQIADLPTPLVEVGLLAIVLLLIGTFDWRTPATDSIILEPYAVLAVLAILPFAVLAWDRAMEARQLRLARSVRYLVIFLLGGWLLFMYLDYVANSIYPTVPEQFGGGQPRTVEIVIADEAMHWAVDVGLVESEASTRSNELKLIWETENALILRNPDTSGDDAVFQIDRSIVSAVIIDPPEIYPEQSEPMVQASPVP